MQRRSFILGTSGILVSPAIKATMTVLGPPSSAGVPTRAWVDHPVHIAQTCPLWCWAASIAMIFSYYGRSISQNSIVQGTFGSTVCVPSGNPGNIAVALSRNWIDSHGQQFQSQVTAAYDAVNGVYAINNYIIVQNLANNHPLLVCNKHHAMVLVSADFFSSPAGPNIQAAGVMDPWPSSPPYHPLMPSELVPAHLGGDLAFLATVAIL